MKLKRFMLQYEPRGIGLEVEDDEGNWEVRHKCLLAKEVASELDILALAEEICESEPELLNARKHRGALLQSLSRLYQIQARTPAEGHRDSPAAAAGSKAPRAEEPATGVPIFEEGRLVVLVGLRGKLQGYNGELAFVSKAHDGSRIEVDVTSSRTDRRDSLKIKGSKHVLRVLPVSRPLAIGTCVVFSELHSHIELNGNIGTVVDVQEQGKRYQVRGKDGQLYRVKTEHVVPVAASEVAGLLGKENLEPNMAVYSSSPSFCRSMSSPTLGSSSPSDGVPDRNDEFLELGSIIEIVGLRNNQLFNGQEAKITGVDREAGRYEVRLLDDDSVKKIKRDNARLVALAPSASVANSSGNRGYGSVIANTLGTASQALRLGRKATWGSP